MVTNFVKVVQAKRMKSLTEYLTFHLPERMAFRNITPQLEQLVEKSGVQEGLLLCNAMHITASVFINDDGRACMKTTRNGSKDSPRSMRRRSNTSTTAPVKTTPTPT